MLQVADLKYLLEAKLLEGDELKSSTDKLLEIIKKNGMFSSHMCIELIFSHAKRVPAGERLHLSHER